jgi:nucleoside-diphosphate-sugar epimerase
MTPPRKHNKVLVTGGLGFIGSTVSERLLAMGLGVTVVDNETSNVIEGQYLTSRFPSARYINANVSEYILNHLTSEHFDLVIHAASYVGASGILPHAGSMAANMLDATSSVIRLCLHQNSDLCFFSSSEIYGKSGVLTESTEIRVPAYFNARIEYALGKLASEAMIANSIPRGLRALVIRPFNVAGPRQSRASGFVLPTFVQQALRNNPITVFGSGLQRRCFLGVTDLADFIETYIVSQHFGSLTVNLGNPSNVTTINSLAQRVKALLNSNSSIDHVSGQSVYGPYYQEAESFEKLCDIKAAMALGWSPSQEIDDLILQTVNHYRVAGHVEHLRVAD